MTVEQEVAAIKAQIAKLQAELETLTNEDEIPAADVAPVVHGYWNKSGECSVCGAYIPTDSCKDAIFSDDLQYCYSCGAKMDGERRESGDDA